MSKLKLRLWDNDNQMLQDVNFNNLNDFIYTLDSYRDYFSYSYFKENDEETGNPLVMLYSGQFDKGNKEICQGDILATEEKDVIFEVCYGECENMASGFYYHSIKGNKNYIMDKGCGKLNIIGNIYKNPEFRGL